MATKRERPESDNLETTILDYLNENNRPYGITDLMANLPGQVKKTALTKALDRLSDKGLIVCKKTGKQPIYWALQLPVEDHELPQGELDRQCYQLTEEAKHQSEVIKRLEAQVREFTGVVSLASLHRKIELRKGEIAHLTQQLTIIEANMSGDPTQSTKLNPKQLKKDLELYRKHYRTRKALFKEILDTILEHSNSKRSKLLEELEVETDEDCQFDPQHWNQF